MPDDEDRRLGVTDDGGRFARLEDRRRVDDHGVEHLREQLQHVGEGAARDDRRAGGDGRSPDVSITRRSSLVCTSASSTVHLPASTSASPVRRSIAVLSGVDHQLVSSTQTLRSRS